MAIDVKKIEADIDAQLNPPEGQMHTSPLHLAVEEHLKKVENNLKVNEMYADGNEQTVAARQEKIAQVREQLHTQIKKSAMDNATAAIDEGARFDSPVGETEEDKKNKGMVNGLFDMLVGSVGGIMGMLLSFLKMIPGVSDALDWAADTLAGKSPEDRQKENALNAAVTGLGQAIDVEGTTFQLSESDVKRIHSNMSKNDYALASEETSASTESSTTTTDLKNLVKQGEEQVLADNNVQESTQGDKGRPLTPAGDPNLQAPNQGAVVSAP
ncbi:MAG: hypothetical protein ACN2B6_02580 [Rickettsiales bacterium]